MTTSTAAVGTSAGAGLRRLVEVSRPISWVNTAYPFAAAYLVAGGGMDLALVLGTAYFLVPYNLLMYGINDVFDYESDLRNARKGGVEGALLDRHWHRLTLRAAVLSNLPFLAAMVLLGSALSILVLAIVVFAVVAYSAPRLRFKERPLVDSLTSSSHFVGPAVLGVALGGGAFTSQVLAALGAFFLWGMASQAFGAVQDIIADRDAGIASVATWLGAANTVRLAMGLYAAAGLVALGIGWPGALAGLLVLPYLANLVPFRSLSDPDAERAHAGWRRFLWLNYLTGFLITQLLLWTALYGGAR